MTKITLFILTLLLNINFTFSQPNEYVAKLERVKIYTAGAEIFRTVNVNLKKGNNEIIIKELSNQTNGNSIVMGAPNGFLIMSTSFQVDYQQVKDQKIPGLQKLLDSQAYYNRQYTLTQNKLNAYNEETAMLRENRKIAGTNGVNVVELEKLSAFYNKRLTIIYNEISNLNDEKNSIRQKQNTLNQEIRTLRSKFPAPPKGEIKVQIDAEKAGIAKIDFSYLAAGASWYPMYDARCEDLTKPIKLVQKANVRQLTGENWENVKLEISTGNPSQGLEIPKLSPRYLDFNYPKVYNSSMSNRAKSSGSYDQAMDKDENYAVDAIEPSANYQESEISTGASGYKKESFKPVYASSNEVAIDYVVDVPYNLPSSNQYQLVTLKSYEIDATYTYFAVPKIDCSVYLTAMLTNWQQYNLIPGTVNLFYQNSFVGKTTLRTSAENDTLRLSLGKDAKIIVKRENQRDYTKIKYFGSNKKETLGYTISINNTNNVAIDIEIEDQIPLSKHSDIVVEVTDKSKGEYNEKDGKIKWSLNLKSGKVEKLTINYEVTSPKNRTVYGL